MLLRPSSGGTNCSGDHEQWLQTPMKDFASSVLLEVVSVNLPLAAVMLCGQVNANRKALCAVAILLKTD